MVKQMPKAKTERLIVREIDDETLVYDRSRDAATCLNEFAAKVWRRCDGETSVAGIAAALGEDERAVWLALHRAEQIAAARWKPSPFRPICAPARPAARLRDSWGSGRPWRPFPASSMTTAAHAQRCSPRLALLGG